MEIPKSIILLCCATICLASHASHTIPVEGYETELQDLGEHVQTHETPVRVIKITKTIAVKVPVPYPVKVVEKVPYPVHVNKPYPVPVPQIIKVPVSHEQHHGQEPLNAGPGQHFQERQHDGTNYEVHELQPPAAESYDDLPNQSYGGGNQENSYVAPNAEYASDSNSFYGQAPQNFHGATGNQNDYNSFDSKSYDQTNQNLNPSGNFGEFNGYH